jgi:lysophospholipase L1-like esterase
MRKILRGIFIAGINFVVLIALLGAIELYFRWKYPAGPAEFATTNGLWQKFAPYVMFLTAPGTYPAWTNKFTGENFSAHVVTNSLGFNDTHEFDYSTPYQKAANERVVLFTGGSVAWGLGSTTTETTIAGRTQYYLNNVQNKIKYTVINLAMGSYIAYQQYIALQLWGESFDPDWVVVMDGFNDAGVGCAYSQGVGNPMYYAIAQAYITDYLFATPHPVFYRGWFENELIKRSAAYRTLTGEQYVPNSLVFDATSTEDMPARTAIIPTKVAQSRDMLAFYIKAERATLGMFPRSRYIFSTQPTVNQFTGDFVDIYASPSDSAAHRDAMAARDAALEEYLTYHQDEMCSAENMQPGFTYIFGKGAILLERLVDKERQAGRDVAYYNVGAILPNDRADRIPYFIDPVHLSDQGADVIGRFYAEKILAADSDRSPTPSR